MLKNMKNTVINNMKAQGYVWCEAVHSFVTKAANCEIEAGCYDPEEIGEQFMENVYLDVFGYSEVAISFHPVTGEHTDGIAYVSVEDGSEYSLLDGWNRSPIYDAVDEDGLPFQWFSVSEDHEDHEDEDEPLKMEKQFNQEIENLREEHWSYDRGTREWCFDGNHVHGYYVDGYYGNIDGNVELSIFAVKDGKVMGHSEEVTLNEAIADTLIEDIERNPNDYFIRVYNFKNGMGEQAFLYHQLDKMPFDKNGIHATGVEYLETNGDWITEYEDDEDYDFIVKEVKF